MSLPQPTPLSSPAMQSLYRLAELVAKSTLPVLISGEPGTGKEFLARFVHEKSGKSGEFVPIDCAALPDTLIESELFGSVRGAFTGAMTARRGVLDAAENGTAFFDEIGELPLHLQAKLLRVLDGYGYRPVGGINIRRIDFRAIAATNRNLVAEVAAGHFREDLYHRLNGLRLTIPPLRARREDVAPLYMALVAEQNGDIGLPPEALARLTAYDWPGNVRELAKCASCMAQIHRCNLTDPCAPPRCDIVSPDLATTQPSAILDAADHASEVRSHNRGLIATTEEALIRKTLVACKGDRKKTASILGIGRTTVYRKMRQYGMIRPRFGAHALGGNRSQATV